MSTDGPRDPLHLSVLTVISVSDLFHPRFYLTLHSKTQLSTPSVELTRPHLLLVRREARLPEQCTTLPKKRDGALAPRRRVKKRRCRVLCVLRPSQQ